MTISCSNDLIWKEKYNDHNHFDYVKNTENYLNLPFLKCLIACDNIPHIHISPKFRVKQTLVGWDGNGESSTLI